jgi:hypothetical protein
MAIYEESQGLGILSFVLGYPVMLKLSRRVFEKVKSVHISSSGPIAALLAASNA